MNLKFGTILSSIISLLSLFVFAYKKEKGDMNSILMYPIVYLLPIIILSWLNGFSIYFLFYKPKLKFKIIFLITICLTLTYFAINFERLKPFNFIIIPLIISSLIISVLNIKKIKLSE